MAVHFKGKGFYNTDYGTKRRNRELRESAESGADKYEAKQAEKKADAKKSDAAAPAARPGEEVGGEEARQEVGLARQAAIKTRAPTAT